MTPAVRRWWSETGFGESPFSRIGRNTSWEFNGNGLEDRPMVGRRQAVIGVTEDPLGNIWILSATDDLDNNCIDIYNSNMMYIGSHIHNIIPYSFIEDGKAVFRKDKGDQAIFILIAIPASDTTTGTADRS